MSSGLGLPRNEPWSEAQWDFYWDLGSDLSLERSMSARGYRQIEGWGDTVGQPIPTPSDRVVKIFRDAYGDELLASGLSLLKRLRGNTWRTKEGQELTAAEMTPSHAANLIPWLERRARIVLLAAQLEIMCVVSDHDGGEMAHDALESEERQLLGADAVEFVRGLLLYKAIAERAKEVFVRGGASADVT